METWIAGHPDGNHKAWSIMASCGFIEGSADASHSELGLQGSLPLGASFRTSLGTLTLCDGLIRHSPSAGWVSFFKFPTGVLQFSLRWWCDLLFFGHFKEPPNHFTPDLFSSLFPFRGLICPGPSLLDDKVCYRL
jgi:hypothetical protein